MAKIIDGTRLGFRDGILELAGKRTDVVLVSCDSLKIMRADPFKEQYSDRLFEVGIAEQNGVAFASGLACSGLMPYVISYAGFLTMRACEQVRTFCAYPGLNVKLVGANGGMFGGGREGVTHQFYEDLGILSSITGVTILMPADGAQTRKAVVAAADIPGVVYIRVGNGQEEKIHPDTEPFVPGKAKILASEGKDVVIFSYGFTLGRCLRAAEELKKKGIGATVVEVSSLRPFDTETVAKIINECERAITVEDHHVNGGLGSAVAAVAAERAIGPVKRLGLDRWPESGESEALLDKYGMSVDVIVAAAAGLK
ncbi:MAG: transketolase C-terminal domain-containing protein [Treponemataceae bacterium]